MRIFQCKVIDKKNKLFKVYVHESDVKRLAICAGSVLLGSVEQGKDFQRRLLTLIEQGISDFYFKGVGKMDKDFLVNISYE